MRFKVIFVGEKEKEVVITKDYRRRFISFLKKVFSEAGEEIYNELYNTTPPKRKPFTFSVWLGSKFHDIPDSDNFLTSPPYEFLFSTGDPLIASHFYNGVLKLKKKDYALSFDSLFHLRIKEISLEKEEIINSRGIIFKTKQPVIITDPEKKEGEEGYYLVPRDSNWHYVLERRLFEDYKRVKGTKLEGKVKFLEINNPIAMEALVRWKKLHEGFLREPIKISRIKHYGGLIRGFKGIFVLCGPVELLQFVYQYGMGIRTGQGFGMLDVLAQLDPKKVCGGEV